MRKIPKNTVICLLFAIVIVNFILRFPRIPHEVGLDSFVMHSLTDALLIKGHADWVLNPLGFFGFYPLSYPSAGMFYVGSISAVLGTDTELATFIGPLFLALIGVFGSFLLGRELSKDIRFALFLAFTLSTAPIFLNFTLWETPTRSLFMALTPFFLFFFMRFHKEENILTIIIMVLIFIVLLASHRLAAVVLLVIMAYVLTLVSIYIVKILKIVTPQFFNQDRYSKKIPFLMFFLVLLAIFVLLQKPILFGEPIGEFERGKLFEGEGYLVAYGNMAVSLARSVGIFLPLAGLGLFSVMEKSNKDFEEPFIIILLLLLIPTLYL
ncbi:MAG TPA: hypothetical protein ENN76_02965, partial [Euryarchaeota archaeon]|nr:hypothetical protein [Euryarchaeota archaeon]